MPADATRPASGDPIADRAFAQLASKDQNWATLDEVRKIAAATGATRARSH
jgi:hypothetical protein